MKEIRRSKDRGFADHGWLRSYHTFSFADYFDEEHIEFGPLRVINQDYVQPGGGFGTHSHRDMEIITYVLEGALEHKDSLGNGSIIQPGDVQRMSAGTGVRHSEFNPSQSESVHFLQIWIQPNRQGVAPSYEERHFDVAERRGQLRLICSSDGDKDSVLIHQDAKVYAGLFEGDENASLSVAPDRRLFVHVARGEITVSGVALQDGDGIKLRQERSLSLSQGRGAEVLVFDLP
jgi:redox-sensitive bicupin YhaK (pirin superfamily)